MEQWPAVGPLVLLLLVGAVVLAVWWRRTDALPDLTDQVREGLGRLYPARPLSPRQLPKRMLRAAAQTVTVGVSGAVVLPTRIVISVHPDELAQIGDLADWTARDIAEALRQRATENGWIVPDGPEVSIVADPERPLRVPRAVGHIGALSPEAFATLQRPMPPVGAAAPAPPAEVEAAVEVEVDNVDEAPTVAAEPVTAYTQIVETGIHLRLVTTSDNTGDADLSAIVLPGEEPVVLGRSREAHLHVRDHKVSARHCAFTVDAQGDLRLEDLRSTNGTLVDDRPVTAGTLSGGETIRVGASTWRVEIGKV